MSFGGWGDDTTARQSINASPSSPTTASFDGSRLEQQLLSKTMTLDISDLVAHPERNTAALPDAWKPAEVKEKESIRSRQIALLGGTSSPPGAGGASGKKPAPGAKFSAAAKFAVALRRAGTDARQNVSGGAAFAGSMHQPTHDDDLAAYIQSKEERRREKEAAKILVADALVPIHVKQQINREIRSHGAFKQQKQYGYTEPVSLPLHRRMEYLARMDEDPTQIQQHRTRAGARAVVGSIASSAAAGGGGVSVNDNSSASNINNFSHQQQQQSGSMMAAKRAAKPEWNTTTSDAQLQLMLPVGSKQKRPKQENAGDAASRTHVSAENITSSSLSSAAVAPPQHLLSSAAAVSPPRHPNKRKGSIDYVAALNEYSRHKANVSAGAPGSADLVSHPRYRSVVLSTTVHQYLTEVGEKESSVALATLPPDASKVVERSVSQTQALRDRVRMQKQELDHLTLSAEAMRRDIAAGAPAARKFAALQQVQIGLLAQKKQREARCRGLIEMTATLTKRWEKQQEQFRGRGDDGSFFPPIHNNNNNNSNSALAKSSFLTEIDPYATDAAGSTRGAGGAGGGFPASLVDPSAATTMTAGALASNVSNSNNNGKSQQLTVQQVQQLHRRVDDLKLRRDGLLKERDRRIRAASAAFESRHERMEKQQQQRRAASSSAPPRSSSNNTNNNKGKSNAFCGDAKRKPAAIDPYAADRAVKPAEPSRREREWIEEQAAACRCKAQHDLDKELERLQRDHDRVMNHRRREADRSVEEIAKTRAEMAAKLGALAATAEQYNCTGAEQKMAQAALDSQVSEKQNQLRQLTERRRNDEQALKRHLQSAAAGKQLLERLRQELLVAENVPVQTHMAEDARRSKLREERTQRVAALKADEQKAAKHVAELERRASQIMHDTQLIQANPAARDSAVTQLDTAATVEERQLGPARSATESAHQRLQQVRQRLYAAKERREANDKQDQEIATLTRALEGKRVKLATENAANLTMLEKLDRAERLLSLSGGIAATKR